MKTQVMVRMEPALKEATETVAAIEHRSLSSMMSYAMEVYISQLYPGALPKKADLTTGRKKK